MVSCVPSPDDDIEWLLTPAERGNGQTRLDDAHQGRAWSEGNLVRPLIHGATYFAELYERIEATGAGDLIVFADWQGDADERLTGEPGSEVLAVLGRAAARGVDVRGLVWHSRAAAVADAEGDNAEFGARLRALGVEAWLDMRVRNRGSHHQKLVVLRHRDDPTRDVAYRGWHRPVPLPPGRRHPRRRPAVRRDGRGVRRHPAVARRAGRDLRSGSARCGDGLPGALGGSGTAGRQSPSLAGTAAAAHLPSQVRRRACCRHSRPRRPPSPVVRTWCSC